ncbi:unnamed protein product [Danaus chrysippus]|uniref:(African queen) hypothetical protein n=1 Tax=Danaus chrysippus TaxID=151541 RepID=A0A8J2MKD3_9NEOP|nr:unnamed protein product [Danaus chrysippus]
MPGDVRAPGPWSRVAGRGRRDVTFLVRPRPSPAPIATDAGYVSRVRPVRTERSTERRKNLFDEMDEDLSQSASGGASPTYDER